MVFDTWKQCLFCVNMIIMSCQLNWKFQFPFQKRKFARIIYHTKKQGRQFLYTFYFGKQLLYLRMYIRTQIRIKALPFFVLSHYDLSPSVKLHSQYQHMASSNFFSHIVIGGVFFRGNLYSNSLCFSKSKCQFLDPYIAQKIQKEATIIHQYISL